MSIARDGSQRCSDVWGNNDRHRSYDDTKSRACPKACIAWAAGSDGRRSMADAASNASAASKLWLGRRRQQQRW